MAGARITPLFSNTNSNSLSQMDVIRKLAIALQVSADMLIFGEDGRGPDDELRLQFEAISKFDSEEKRVIKSLLDGMILKHQAKRWSSST